MMTAPSFWQIPALAKHVDVAQNLKLAAAKPADKPFALSRVRLAIKISRLDSSLPELRGDPLRMLTGRTKHELANTRRPLDRLLDDVPDQ